MRTPATPPWALILAGGDGIRLRALTTQIVGDGRPKQFCPLLDGESLLDRTRRRADLVARLDRQVVVVTRSHEPYYRELAGEIVPGRLVIQPENRGTGPGILYPLLRVLHLAGDVPVVVLPSDHYVSDDLAFMAYARSAVEVVRARPPAVVLLGIEPEWPETEYGWIEPRETPLDLHGEPVFPIRRFWEKPSPPAAESLLGRGCLWNSFVMVGSARGLLNLMSTYAPELTVAFDGVRRVLGTPAEADAVERLYAGLPSTNFSDRVLAQAPGHLVTMRVKGVDWSDWGNPQRVLATVRRSGWRPAWLSRVALASAR
jgi:mannose-1-phosphate guanylyltransferase